MGASHFCTTLFENSNFLLHTFAALEGWTRILFEILPSAALFGAFLVVRPAFACFTRLGPRFSVSSRLTLFPNTNEDIASSSCLNEILRNMRNVFLKAEKKSKLHWSKSLLCYSAARNSVVPICLLALDCLNFAYSWVWNEPKSRQARWIPR